MKSSCSKPAPLLWSGKLRVAFPGAKLVSGGGNGAEKEEKEHSASELDGPQMISQPAENAGAECQGLPARPGGARGRALRGWDGAGTPQGFALVASGLSGAPCGCNGPAPKADAHRCQHLFLCINIPCQKWTCWTQNWSLSGDKAQLSLGLTLGRSVPSQHRS